MGLDDFIITCCCWIDDLLPKATGGRKVRQAGPQPILSDSEVITIEIVGSYLELSQDRELFEYFGRHYGHFFPGPARNPSLDLCASSGQCVGSQRAIVDAVAR